MEGWRVATLLFMDKFLFKFYFVVTAIFLWSLMHNRPYDEPDADDFEEEWSDDENDDT